MSKRLVLSLTDGEYLRLKQAYLSESTTDSEAPASLPRWLKWRIFKSSITEDAPEKEARI